MAPSLSSGGVARPLSSTVKPSLRRSSALPRPTSNETPLAATCMVTPSPMLALSGFHVGQYVDAARGRSRPASLLRKPPRAFDQSCPGGAATDTALLPAPTTSAPPPGSA